MDNILTIKSQDKNEPLYVLGMVYGKYGMDFNVESTHYCRHWPRVSIYCSLYKPHIVKKYDLYYL